MDQSTTRILTTHVGSLPRDPKLIDLLQLRDTGLGAEDENAAQLIKQSVDAVIARQCDCGIDIVNDGEHAKSSFSTYTGRRLGGLDPVEAPFRDFKPKTRDRLAFPAVYDEQEVMCAARPNKATPRLFRTYVCTGPITYKGQADVAADIENLRTGIGERSVDGFITALSPGNISMYYRNDYYRTQEEYLLAIADAMREEYKAIIDAGFIVQIDDPRLATHYDRNPDISLEECRRFIAWQVDVLNHGLRGLPRERVRYHTCYSTNVAPRVHDLELQHYLDLILKINASGFSFEAGNPRHEHEWAIWAAAKLPDDVVLLPGVVSHCVHLVEHPELVAQRIERYAAIVGRERVIASNDCGFATSGAGDEVHPHVAWAKLASLVEGAKLATDRLWR